MSRLVHFVVAYDVRDDRRRIQLFRFLKGMGFQMQYSVFEGRLPPESVVRLRYGIRRIIKPSEDRVVLIRLCEACSKKVERFGTQEDLPGDVIII